MKKQNAQELDTGQSQESKKNPSSLVSQPTKTEPKKISDSAMSQPQSTSGSNQIGSKKMTKVLLENEAPSGSENILQKSQKKQKSLMPVPKLPSDGKRGEQALKRLKVKPEQLSSAPPITPLLKKTIKGGLKAALEAMRWATEDTEIRAFFRVYDKVPKGDQGRIPWEAVAIAAKVNPKHLLGAIQLAVQTHCWNRSRFIAVSNHPDVTEKRVEFAKMAGGERDRTQLDIALGILQSPKGPTFIGKQVAVFGGTGNQKVSKVEDDEDEEKTIHANSSDSDLIDTLFPSPREVQDKLVPIRQRLLEG